MRFDPCMQQDIDEPWPLHILDHEGKRHYVDMQPGEMVLYEGATLIHGRPRPLKGKHYDNLTVHMVRA